MRAILGFFVHRWAKMIRELAKLLSKRHHELWIAVNLIDQLSQHRNQLFNAAFRSKQVRNLIKSLNRVHLRIGVLTAQIVDQERHCRYCVHLI